MNAIRPYKQVKNFLIEVIEQAQYAPDYQLPSERMLASKFKASRRSIRMAYENLIEQGLVVRVHGKGHFTTGNQTKNAHMPLANKKIYFIAPALRTVFMQDILNGITDFCDEHTMDVSIKLSKGNLSKELQYIHSAISSDTKGIILFPSDNELINNELFKVSASRYPLAIIDRYFKNMNFSYISTDHYNAMLEAIKFLHAKKHKSILYLTSPNSLATSIGERLNGFTDGIMKYYGNAKQGNVLTMEYFYPEEIKQNIANYLKENPNTDVIITTGLHITTDAIIAAVNSLNLSIPKDIKLMVFDNEFSSTEINLIRPYVIQQDSYQIGYKSASALYNQIYGDLRTENVRLPVNIVDYT